MVRIDGKYKLEKSENFDEFLQELGVSAENRQLVNSVVPVLEISVQGDVYTIKTESARPTEIKFKLGEEFDETRADGKQVKSLITKEGDNKLVQIQKGDQEVSIVREFNDQGVTIMATFNGVTCVRFYKRLD